MQQELVAEDCYLQAQLEQQRDLKLQALQHEHSTKAQATQQAQESIQSQVHLPMVSSCEDVKNNQ